MSPQFDNLIQWKDPFKSGVVMVVVLTGLISLSYLSFISVVAYTGLAVLCCSMGARLYRTILAPAAKPDNEPSASSTSDWSVKDFQLPRDKVSDQVVSIASQLEPYLVRLQHCILIKDYVDTAKFLLVLYVLAVLGSWFNLLTLVTVAFVFLFTGPRFYRMYQSQCDALYEKVQKQVKVIGAKLEPTLKKFRKQPIKN